MIHEPCGFLGYTDSAVNFIRRDAVLAVHYLPHGRHPLVQTDGRVFHDAASLHGELRSGVLGAAMPAVVLLKEQHVFASALRAFNAFSPAPRYHIFTAICGITEVYDGF